MQCIYNLLRPPLRAFIILQTFQDFPTLRFGLPHKNQPQKLSRRIWGLHSPILPFRPKDDHSLDSRWCLFTSHADLPTFSQRLLEKLASLQPTEMPRILETWRNISLLLEWKGVQGNDEEIGDCQNLQSYEISPESIMHCRQSFSIFILYPLIVFGYFNKNT